MSDSQSPRILLVTYPRSASNLLIRILNLPDQLKVYTPNALAGYLFTSTATQIKDSNAWAAPLDAWPDELAERVKQCYLDGFTETQKTVSKGVELGRVVFVKEHIQGLLHPLAQQRFVFGSDTALKPEDLRRWDFSTTDGENVTRSPLNDTVLPDKSLELWKPIFLIRHPALAFPSQYKIFRELKGDEDEDPSGGKERWLNLFLTLHWTRRLYEFYCEKRDIKGERDGDECKGRVEDDSPSPGLLEWPVIVDADDIITSPVIVERLASQIGMDVSNLKFKWNAMPVEDRKKISPLLQTMLSTLLASDGIQITKAAGQVVDIEAEKKKWKNEWGERKAEKLETWVQAAMEDYLFLRERRMKCDV
jgi:hypothetical protein